MRHLFGLLLILTVLIDFSATCLADDVFMGEGCTIVQELTHSECTANEDEKSHSDHSKNKGGHCHIGHLHMALIQLTPPPAAFNPEKIHSSFSEVNLFIPPSFLKDFTRPPIMV